MTIGKQYDVHSHRFVLSQIFQVLLFVYSRRDCRKFSAFRLNYYTLTHWAVYQKQTDLRIDQSTDWLTGWLIDRSISSLNDYLVQEVIRISAHQQDLWNHYASASPGLLKIVNRVKPPRRPVTQCLNESQPRVGQYGYHFIMAASSWFNKVKGYMIYHLSVICHAGLRTFDHANWFPW